ncbi:MAG: hypothetical protein MUE52_19360 [Tabrizicola sp.]|jgi:hypothetical protein|nr:hypothetical protein [Tabrizicola sp.]
MRLSRSVVLMVLAGRTRPVVAALLAPFWPGHDQSQAEARLARLSPRDEGMISAAVLALLFLLAVFAAQFGLLGMAAYFLAIILIVR